MFYVIGFEVEKLGFWPYLKSNETQQLTFAHMKHDIITFYQLVHKHYLLSPANIGDFKLSSREVKHFI